MRSPVPCLIALSLALATVSPVRADWMVNYDVAVAAAPIGPFGPSATIWSDGTASVVLSGQLTNGLGSQGVNDSYSLANFFALADASTPKTMTHKAFFLKLNLHDQTNGKSGSLILTGDLTSSMYPYVFSVTDPQTQSLTLGNYRYDVTLWRNPIGDPVGAGFSEGPGEPPPSQWGQRSEVYATIDRTALAAAPEPATWILAGQCLLAAGFATWRRRSK
jgi:hypothetical protein